jgi:hypothetical protein
MKNKKVLAFVDPKEETEKLKRRFDELLKKSNKSEPDVKDVDALRELLQENRGQDLHGDVLEIMGMAESYLLQEGSPLGRSGMNEIIREQQRDLRQRLGFDDVPEMEKLLIAHVALCWLRLGLLEISYTRVMSKSTSLALNMYWEKRLTLAQRRYTRACETLELVRKMARSSPALRLAKTGT